jgi:hypothetical protein
MRLAPQAHAAIMMALQKAIMEEIDIRPLLDELDFVVDDDEPEFLVVTNPPTFKITGELEEVVEKKAFNWE